MDCNTVFSNLSNDFRNKFLLYWHSSRRQFFMPPQACINDHSEEWRKPHSKAVCPMEQKLIQVVVHNDLVVIFSRWRLRWYLQHVQETWFLLSGACHYRCIIQSLVLNIAGLALFLCSHLFKQHDTVVNRNYGTHIRCGKHPELWPAFGRVGIVPEYVTKIKRLT